MNQRPDVNPADTIVAISSAVGPAARMIVRLAGPDAFRLLRRLAPGAQARPSSVERVLLHFDGIACPAWAYTFVTPRSYTGDDLVELHLPGNPLLARVLIDTLLALGARPAEAGEFTARAFLNGRIDLAAAEGVALTIAATHAGELRAARQLLAGELSRRLAEPLRSLADALALLESNIDFAEEDIAFIDGDELRRRVTAAAAALDELATNTARTERLTGEPSFVLVGLPNAGKSTLLNALAGHERAVVSPVAGTTRDALSAEVALARGLVRVIDVAGLERAGDDDIARQMQARAARAVEEADFVVEVRDVTQSTSAWLSRPADLVVYTKADLLPQPATESDQTAVVSAANGHGLAVLRERMDALAFGEDRGDALALTARHVAAVDAARSALVRAAALPDDATEIIAEEVRRAVDALGEVLGRVTPDDVLGRVFASFCVGK